MTLQIEIEVERLNGLKATKMKELIFRRQSELEEIYKGVHMDIDSDKAWQLLISLVESGLVNFFFFFTKKCFYIILYMFFILYAEDTCFCLCCCASLMLTCHLLSFE